LKTGTKNSASLVAFAFKNKLIKMWTEKKPGKLPWL
jgi:hypothetical protein